jgi:hypothetical protein
MLIGGCTPSVPVATQMVTPVPYTVSTLTLHLNGCSHGQEGRLFVWYVYINETCDATKKKQSWPDITIYGPGSKNLDTDSCKHDPSRTVVTQIKLQETPKYIGGVEAAYYTSMPCGLDYDEVSSLYTVESKGFRFTTTTTKTFKVEHFLKDLTWSS